MLKKIFKGHFVILALLLAVTAFLSPYALKIKMDNSVEALGVIGDPAVGMTHKLEGIFGSEEFISISFRVEDIFSPFSLNLIKNLTADLKKINNVKTVTSLTEAQGLKAETKNGEESISLGALVKPEWVDAGVPEKEKLLILQNPLYQRLLYSADGKSTSFFIEFLPTIGRDDAARDELIDSIQKVLAGYEKSTGVKFHTLGMPQVYRKLYSIAEREQNKTALVILAIVAVLFWVLYRKLSLVLLPVFLFTIVAIWITGLINLFGFSYNWLLAIAPAVVLIISICNSIHVINSYLSNPEPDLKKRVVLVLKLLWLPSFFTCLTDISGFFSISTSQIIPIRDFGICVGIGSVVSFLVVMFILPQFLALVKNKNQNEKPSFLDRWIQIALQYSLNLGFKKTGRVLLIVGIISVVGLLGMFFLRPQQDLLTMFKWGGESLIEANEFVKKNSGGGAEFYGYVDTHKTEGCFEPELLRQLDKSQAETEKKVSNIVIQTISLADLIKYANQVMNGNDPAFYKIPDTKAQVAQLALLYSMSEKKDLLESLVTEDYSKSIVRIFVFFVDSAQVASGIELTEDIFREALPKEVYFNLSGRPVILMNTFNNLIQSQITSLGTAVFIIFIGMSLLFKSLKTGLICMVPNILPIFVSMGLQGWMGIEINVATAMVGATVMGITVDDTIHFMWRLKGKIKEGVSYEHGIREVFSEAGKSAFFSTFVVALGFSGLVISQLWPSTQYGLLVAMNCLVALLTELFVTPALLYRLKPFK